MIEPIEIKEIAFASPLYEASKRIRQDVLRYPLGLILSEQDVAGEHDQIHIVAYENGQMIGTVLLKPLLQDKVKLRQMAVLPSYQGRGLGKALVIFAQHLAKDRHFSVIETHARVSAQGFYEKLGYRVLGEAFTEVTVPTIKMRKVLS